MFYRQKIGDDASILRIIHTGHLRLPFSWAAPCPRNCADPNLRRRWPATQVHVNSKFTALELNLTQTLAWWCPARSAVASLAQRQAVPPIGQWETISQQSLVSQQRVSTRPQATQKLVAGTAAIQGSMGCMPPTIWRQTPHTHFKALTAIRLPAPKHLAAFATAWPSAATAARRSR